MDNHITDREILITGTLNAPIHLVWEAWSKPEHIAQWWGPNGFTNTITKMDLKPGGEWNLVMHGPDGTDYKNESIFKEVNLNKRIVYDHISAPQFTSTIEFEAQGDHTLLKWRMLFETDALFIQVVKTFKADEGLKQNIDKFGTYLSKMRTNQ